MMCACTITYLMKSWLYVSFLICSDYIKRITSPLITRSALIQKIIFTPNNNNLIPTRNPDPSHLKYILIRLLLSTNNAKSSYIKHTWNLIYVSFSQTITNKPHINYSKNPTCKGIKLQHNSKKYMLHISTESNCCC